MDPLRPLLRWCAAVVPASVRGAWPRLRALIVLFHVTAIATVACPAPVRVGSIKQWDRPSVRSELRNWRARLAVVGVSVSEDELRDFGRGTALRWSALRSSSLQPFLVYLKAIGAPQGWYMFTAPDRNPQRLSADLIKDGGERVHVFTLGKDVARPDIIAPSFLEEHRVRRVLFQTAWSDRQPTFKDVCTWIGRRALQVEPGVQEIECTQIEFQVEHPWKTEKKTPEQVRNSVRLPMTREALDELDAKRVRKRARAAARAAAKEEEAAP